MLTEKMNRAIASLVGALICYFVLIFLEKKNFTIIVDLLFSSSSEGYVNLHSLILIIGMMIIIQVSHEAGTFQFIAINLIKLSKGKPIRLMLIFCGITVLISAILNNILTVIILIPLTITVSRILNINPQPYILTQAILVNIGGTVFSISSIPNILITTYANISFLDFFLNVGLISFIVFGFTIIFFIFIYRKELTISEEGVKVFKEYNVWNFVQSKKLLFQSILSLVILLVLFIVLPPSFIPPDIIALTIAMVLVIISRLEPKELITKVDLELIFYLLGIFVIAGSLEISGILNLIGDFISFLAQGNFFSLLLLTLWLSGFLSSSIDNIPITKVMIPIIDNIPGIASFTQKSQLFFSLAIGANWGDNLTPLGDNILVVNIAEQNKRPISFKSFFKLGFITTIYQLLIVSMIYILIFTFIVGIVILVSILFILFVLFILNQKVNRINKKLSSIIQKIRYLIIK
ncbi:MAG: SLC13 family permease [Candidatus Lokiarchaeota archaeon]